MKTYFSHVKLHGKHVNLCTATSNYIELNAHTSMTLAPTVFLAARCADGGQDGRVSRSARPVDPQQIAMGGMSGFDVTFLVRAVTLLGRMLFSDANNKQSANFFFFRRQRSSTSCATCLQHLTPIANQPCFSNFLILNFKS